VHRNDVGGRSVFLRDAAARTRSLLFIVSVLYCVSGE
jgi:hypothetical protein